MIKLFSSDDRVLIYHLQNMLATEGLESIIKNDLMYTLAGEVPVNEVWPELWLLADAEQDRAEKIIEQVTCSENLPEHDWTCTQCGEVHAAQFSECWQCGSERAG